MRCPQNAGSAFFCRQKRDSYRETAPLFDHFTAYFFFLRTAAVPPAMPPLTKSSGSKVPDGSCRRSRGCFSLPRQWRQAPLSRFRAFSKGLCIVCRDAVNCPDLVAVHHTDERRRAVDGGGVFAVIRLILNFQPRDRQFLCGNGRRCACGLRRQHIVRGVVPAEREVEAVTVAASFAANTDNGITENSRMTVSSTEKIRFFSVMAVFISLLLYTRFAIAAKNSP